MIRRVTGVVAALAMTGALAGAQVQIDQSLPYYQQASGVSGALKSVGSDTMNNLMTYWFERYAQFYPNVSTEVEGKGSSTAPPALIEGLGQFGPMSRPMKSAEIDQFEKKFGYKPTELPVAIDALAVYVHKDNPIQSLTMGQLKQIFSVAGPDMTWGEVGLKGEWASKPISLYGRNSASGTYGYFKEHALAKTDFKATVKEQPGSSSVVQAIATDKFAMGYSGLGYLTADVRAVPITPAGGARPFEANVANAMSGDYPLARFLYLYVNMKPGSPLDPLRREFLKMVYSQQGQEVVVKDGYFPVTAPIARESLKKCGVAATF